MDKTAEPKKSPATTDLSVSASGVLETAPESVRSAKDTPPEKAKPVRSAKDAINAMYAEERKETLSNYLATSAKEIINADKKSSSKNTAASMHRGSTRRRIETVRPSASGVMRTAKSEPKQAPSDTTHAMDPLAQKTAPIVTRPVVKSDDAPASAPVVKTSLKLGPKKSPTVMRPSSQSSRAFATKQNLNAPKGQTALARLLANRRAQTAQQAATSAAPVKRHITMTDIVGKPHHVPSDGSKAAETLRVMQQAVDKTTGKASDDAPKVTPRPKSRPPRGLMQDVIRPGGAKPKQKFAHPSDELPLDSVKRRFRAAPKGYTAAAEVQSDSYVPEEPVDFDSKPPVEIYGLMDEEPTGRRPEVPVIEDYHPDDKSKSPDNNKYTIKGQSPLFLKTVNVEKRPLSGSVGSRKDTPDGTLYEQPDTTPLSEKNLYSKKESKKSLPTKPTVIIPASRRSRAPMVFLLILTVILGAAVGAFVYLCFFQYME